jgi:hypothetical protein
MARGESWSATLSGVPKPVAKVLRNIELPRSVVKQSTPATSRSSTTDSPVLDSEVPGHRARR